MDVWGLRLSTHETLKSNQTHDSRGHDAPKRTLLGAATANDSTTRDQPRIKTAEIVHNYLTMVTNSILNALYCERWS